MGTGFYVLGLGKKRFTGFEISWNWIKLSRNVRQIFLAVLSDSVHCLILSFQ